ncbi:MAG: hypothetical protein ACRBFS_23780 [Aureispira sp.]
MIKKYHFYLFFIGCITFASPIFAIEGISILASRQLLEQPTVQRTVDDCILLLQQACQCPVNVNDKQQEILLVLPELDLDSIPTLSSASQQLPYPSIDYPSHQYNWTSKRKGKQLELRLESPTYVGISFGLYGLLQEQLWFAFYHPKKSIIPQLDFWPLTEDFSWSARPRFAKKGFHLHTMHPLELTEPLLNPDCPNGIAQVKEYIDWLVHNQQNYFEFNLLENDDLERWLLYIKPAVEYAHERGVLVGLDISLHMTQQKAFKLYHNFPATIKGAKKQIAERLAMLFQVSWDVIALEGSTTEFTKGNVAKTQALTLFVTDLVVNTYGAHLAGRQHVVKDDQMLNKSSQKDTLTTEEKALEVNRAFFIHTVMFYGLTDTAAPVYQNKNLLHLLDLLKKEQQQRETWYFPESAYWITFDNSVPMYLMPYLQTRLDDILLMDSLEVEGHLTFSSGWEWGYWSIDWSIARWSWSHTFNGRAMRPNATQFLGDIFHNQNIMNYINQLAILQQDYLKEQQLIRYVVAQTVTDELPTPLSLEFHPRPYKPYRWIRKKAPFAYLDQFKQDVIQPLSNFSQQSAALLEQFAKEQYDLTPERQNILEELQAALTVTQLRSQHKVHTLTALQQRRASQLDKNQVHDWETELAKASVVRLKAQQFVEQQEQSYRYPLAQIGRPLEDGGCTAYAYGYLYPVSNLHFWQREEQQILQDKYGAFFMSIWDVPRILGIVP